MLDQYVGLKIEDDRPCWKLVRLVLKEQAGINLPSYDDEDRNGSSIETYAASYKTIMMHEARALDVAILLTALRENDKYVFRPAHIGIFCNSFQILHIERGNLSRTQLAKELKIHSILRVT